MMVKKNPDDTEQSAFWRGEFGDEYIDRNTITSKSLANRLAMWGRVLRSVQCDPPKSILEVGTNIGGNIHALAKITGAELFGIEPNAKAREILKKSGMMPPENLHEGLSFDIPLPDGAVEMAFTSGVLIHVAPADLERSCREIHRVASKYIVCIEYFAAKPEEIGYRGHTERLFKRDFGGYWIDLFPGLVVLDYGFEWSRATGMDDSTWWVFRKA
jgi:spore coat polysaccharide biosynthesis protein SpsF